MQPFGLLELLQSFLPLNNNTVSPDTTAEKEETNTDTNSVPVINEPTPTYSAAQNAVLGFMDAHERRAKRLR
ncbi:MAG: hypothetical protein IKA40_00295 [Clostridia bacterium]|nr:hypothetical protein [Clostridia bacterium]